MPARIPQSVREEQLNTLPGKRFVRWADGWYKNIFSKAVMKCRNDGHEWPASVGDLINAGNGCPKCADKYVYSAQEREEQLNALAGKRFIQWDGEYRNKDSKAVMRCDTGHEWVASISSLLNRGSGCPACAKHGFNPDSPATLYALRSRCGRH
ncbi:zinc-ribbon domain-containing protein, partial [Klebsiella pneumoniae]